MTHPIRLPIYKNKKIATNFFSTALYLYIICQRIPKVKLANGFCHRVLKSVNSSTSKAVKNDSILSLFVTFPTMSLTSFPLMPYTAKNLIQNREITKSTFETMQQFLKYYFI